MLSIARKNLSSLFLSPNSFLCNSNVPFSTSRFKRVVPSPKIYDVLVHKHQFSPELASFAASHFSGVRSPKRADSILSFLKENSFTTAQLEKIVIYNPRILGVSVEGIKLKLKVFHDLGLSSVEIAKVMFNSKVILHLSTANKIIPTLSKLKGFLGSNEDVATLLKKCSWFATYDLDRTLMPNVEILKSRGIPMDRILHFLYTQPRCFLVKPGVMRKSVDKAIEFGVSHASVTFIYAAGVFANMSEGIWEVKLQTLRDLGFSDNDILTIFRKSPAVFSSSLEKVKKITELLLATGEYNISSIVSHSSSLGYSIEKRLEPRLQILGILETNNLIKKWPALGTFCTISDDKFLERFVDPYSEQVGKSFNQMSYLKGKINEI